MTYTLGVDPGRSGAAVLLEGDRRVVGWWAWTLLGRKAGESWRLRWPDGVADLGDNAASLGAIGCGIRNAVRPWPSAGNDWPDLVVEGLFVPRARAGGRPVDPQSVIPLAEATGELIGGLGLRPRARPPANVWRPAMLGIPARTPADEAEAYAIRMYPTTFGALPEGLTRGELGAVCEAAWIARWGAL